MACSLPARVGISPVHTNKIPTLRMGYRFGHYVIEPSDYLRGR